MEESLLVPFTAVVSAFAYITFISVFLRRRIAQRGGAFRKAKELFFEELRRRVTLGVIRDLDDVAMVKNWAMREAESNRFEVMPLVGLLEEFLSTVTKGVQDEGRAKAEYIFVESLIDTKRAQEPFSILPVEERTKAQYLVQSIESGQKEDAVSRLQELTNSLGGRLLALDKNATRNKNLAIIAAIASISAIPLAIIF